MWAFAKKLFSSCSNSRIPSFFRQSMAKIKADIAKKNRAEWFVISAVFVGWWYSFFAQGTAEWLDPSERRKNSFLHISILFATSTKLDMCAYFSLSRWPIMLQMPFVPESWWHPIISHLRHLGEGSFAWQDELWIIKFVLEITNIKLLNNLENAITVNADIAIFFLLYISYISYLLWRINMS